MTTYQSFTLKFSWNDSTDALAYARLTLSVIGIDIDLRCALRDCVSASAVLIVQ